MKKNYTKDLISACQRSQDKPLTEVKKAIKFILKRIIKEAFEKSGITIVGFGKFNKHKRNAKPLYLKNATQRVPAREVLQCSFSKYFTH